MALASMKPTSSYLLASRRHILNEGMFSQQDWNCQKMRHNTYTCLLTHLQHYCIGKRINTQSNKSFPMPSTCGTDAGISTYRFAQVLVIEPLMILPQIQGESQRISCLCFPKVLSRSTAQQVLIHHLNQSEIFIKTQYHHTVTEH